MNQQIPNQPTQSHEAETEFKPKGAIAFIVALLLTFAAIWLGVFYIMIDRA